MNNWHQIYCNKQLFHNIKIYTNNSIVKKSVEFNLCQLKRFFNKFQYIEYLYVNDIVDRTKLAKSIFGQYYDSQVIFNSVYSNKQLTIFQQKYIQQHIDVPTNILVSFMEKFNFSIPSKQQYYQFIKHLHIANDYNLCYTNRDYIMFVNYEKQLLIYDLPFENITFTKNGHIFIYDLEIYNLKEFEQYA